MSDVLGQAIYDHHKNIKAAKLWIHNKYGPKEEMPVETFFRNGDELPDLEWRALNNCRGKVLDIGAGAGSHTLLLQQSGFDVTAIDISSLAVKVMNDRSVLNAFEQDIFTYNPNSKYDTILLLMNGIGLAGTLDGLSKLLDHLKSLLNDGGQILFDSSDVSYIYEDGQPTQNYYGEIAYQYQYKNLITNWFNWLYVDKDTLQQYATRAGFKCQILLEDEYGQYLTRLIR